MYVLATRDNGFSNLEIEGDSKIVIDCFNRKSSLPSSIILLMEDVWRISQNLNIVNSCHIYREANRTTNCLAKKGSCNIDSNIWRLDFPKDVRKVAFEDYCDSSFNRFCKFSFP